MVRGMVVAHVTDGDGVCPRKEGPSPDFGLGMKPLPRLSDRLLDMPFHPLYHPSVELYCTGWARHQRNEPFPLHRHWIQWLDSTIIAQQAQ
jgi:hypothetical protein